MRLDDPALRQTAFATDAVVLEIAYTIGPALIALAVAIGPPGTPLASALAFTAAAVPTMFALGGRARLVDALRDRRSAPAGPAARPPAAGAVRGIVHARDVVRRDRGGLPELRPRRRRGRLGAGPDRGLLGGERDRGSLLRRPARACAAVCLPLAMAAMAIPLAAHLPVANPWLLALVAFLAGALIAPAMTIVSLLVSEFSPPRYTTEVFTWSATAIVTGLGAGMSVSGVLVERHGPGGAFAWATASAVAAAGFALALRARR